LIFIKNFYIKSFFLSPSVTESIYRQLATDAGEPKSKNDVRTTKKGDSGCSWLHNSNQRTVTVYKMLGQTNVSPKELTGRGVHHN